MKEITTKLLRDYCVMWCDRWGATCSNNVDDWVKVVEGANHVIGSNWGGTNPSPFKRAAATAIAIVEVAPIDEHLPAKIVEDFSLDQKMARHPKMLRAIVGHAFARFLLVGAEIGDKSRDRTLKNPIKISPHFYRDVVWVLARTGFVNGEMFNPLALIYEACAYQTNPNSQDHI